MRFPKPQSFPELRAFESGNKDTITRIEEISIYIAALLSEHSAQSAVLGMRLETNRFGNLCSIVIIYV